jgi:TrpR family transcriptional regulator, trp operon repressor
MEERKLNEDAIQELSRTLANCTDALLIEDFLKSLLTEAEVQGVANRWALVRLLDKGMSQRNIAKELGLSLCNITRGSKELKKENSPFAAMIDEYKKIS